MCTTGSRSDRSPFASSVCPSTTTVSPCSMNWSVLSSNLSHAPTTCWRTAIAACFPSCRPEPGSSDAFEPSQTKSSLHRSSAPSRSPWLKRWYRSLNASVLPAMPRSSFVCCPKQRDRNAGPHDESTSLVVLQAHRRTRRWLRSHPSAQAATVANAPRADWHSLHASSERLRRLRQRPAQTTARRLPQTALAPANRALRRSATPVGALLLEAEAEAR